MNSMLREVMVLVCLGAMAVSSFAAPLSSSVRPAIPAEVQQIICVDYRALKNSDVAQALKAQVLPDNLKEFETALKSTGIDTNRDVDTLTFIAYRLPKQGLRMVGAAQGAFALKDILRKLKLQKVKPVKYRDSDIYPMANGMQMTFLDDTTLVVGDGSAVRGSLDARDGYTQTLDSNPDIANLIEDVQGGSVWSILDQKGTQNAIMSGMGEARSEERRVGKEWRCGWGREYEKEKK